MKRNDILFGLFKDVPLESRMFKELMSTKYGVEDPHDLYVAIVNYQIDKYGTPLSYRDFILKDSEENRQITERDRARRHSRYESHYKRK